MSQALNAQKAKDGMPMRGGKKIPTISATHSITSTHSIASSKHQSPHQSVMLDLSRFQDNVNSQPRMKTRTKSKREIDQENSKGVSWQDVRHGVGRLSSSLTAAPQDAQQSIFRSLAPSLSMSNSQLEALQRSRETESLVESDLENVWSRSVYQKRPPSISRVSTSRRKTPAHYSFKYSWIPQPLLHNAVNNLYYEKTFRDFNRESIALFRRDFHKEIRDDLPATVSTQLQNELLRVVESDLDYDEPTHPIDERLSDKQSLAEASELSQSIMLDEDDSSVFSPTSIASKSRRSRPQQEGDRTIVRSLKGDDRQAWSISASSRPSNSQKLQSHDLENSIISDDLSIFDHNMSHDSGGLFLTSLTQGLSAPVAATARGKNIRVALPPPRDLDDFIQSQVPGKLLQPSTTLQSTSEHIVFEGVQRHKKFRYRPPLTVGAKISPEIPTHAYGFR
jgi:hypothetical protein